MRGIVGGGGEIKKNCSNYSDNLSEDITRGLAYYNFATVSFNMIIAEKTRKTACFWHFLDTFSYKKIAKIDFFEKSKYAYIHI